jgi:hypothetical protein
VKNFGYLTRQWTGLYPQTKKLTNWAKKIYFGDIVVSLSVTVIFYQKTKISEEEPPLFIVIEAVSHTTLLANTGKAFTCFIKRRKY